MRFSRAQSVIVVVLFCSTIAGMFLANGSDAVRIGKSFLKTSAAEGLASVDFSEFEEAYSSLYSGDSVWVDTFGLVNRLLNKREVADFEVVKDFSNSLYVPEDETAKEDPNKALESILALSDRSLAMGAQFVFVQPPYKTYDEKRELVGYASSYLDDDFDYIVRGLEKHGIPAVDLRAVEDCREWYRTDHHWTCDAAFVATQTIVDELAKSGCEDLLGDQAQLSDVSMYDRVEFPDSFLGSAGVKTGKLYAGKDDFSYLSPMFRTDLVYRHYKDGACDREHSGSFDDTFIDRVLLENPNYLNKYNSFLYTGYVESVIENRLASNDLKVLLVSHSYGRPVAQYLSLYVAETRYLDPQAGRYNEDYLAYVEEYKPDIVIVMYDGAFNIGKDPSEG